MFGLLTTAPAAFLVWDGHPVLFQIGGAKLRTYALLFALGLVGGYNLFHWLTEDDGDDAADAGRFVLWSVPALLLGARLAHVLFYDPDPARFLADPLRFFALWEGGLASHGAGVALLLLAWFWTRRRRLPFRVFVDRLMAALPAAIVCVRLGNFANSEIVGRPTDVPWGVVFTRFIERDPTQAAAGLAPDALAWLPQHLPRHPSQLYEALAGLALLVVVVAVHRAYRRAGAPRPLGLYTGLMFVLYFGGRFTLEAFKEYQSLSPGGLTMGQWLSAPFLLIGVACLWAVLAGPWRGQTARDAVAAARGASGSPRPERPKGSRARGPGRRG